MAFASCVQSMKTLIIIFSLLTLACSLETNMNRTIFIPVAGWRFEMPCKLYFTDSAFNKEGQLTEAIPDDGSRLKLFVSKFPDKSSFVAYLWKDTLDTKEWKDYHDKDTEWYFNQMRQLPQMIVLDTKYSNETVGDVDFLVQHVKFITKSTNDTGYTYHYFGKLNDKGLDISFEHYSKELGKFFHDILNSSTFSKCRRKNCSFYTISFTASRNVSISSFVLK